MKSVLRFAHRTTLYSGLCLIVILALALTALRFWLLPGASSYRHRLETQLGSLIGETVRIEGLSARLHGFHPELSLNGFHILDSRGKPAIRFAAIRIDIDPLRSLLTREPSFDRLEIVGAKLSIRRRQDGTIGIVGLNASDRPPAWLMADGRFELLDCDLDWQDLQGNGPPLALGQADIRLVNNGGKHKLGLDLALPKRLGKAFRLALDAEGNLFQVEKWSGKLYLEGKLIDTAQITDALPRPYFAMKSGTVDFRLWGHWNGALNSVAGDIELAKPIFALRRDTHTEDQLALASLESRFRWQRENDGWRLDLDRFRPALNRVWPESRLSLALTRRPDGTPSVVRAAASYLELGDINTALHALPLLDAEAGGILRDLAPRGSLRNASFFFAPERSMGERIALCGKFDDLGANAWQSLPGFSGLSGKLCGNDQTGRVTLSVENGNIQPATLGLKTPVRLNKARADLFWRQTDIDWSFSSRSLSVENDDLAARGRFRAVLPKNKEASAFLDLRMQFGEMNMVALKNYLPFAVIPQTSTWVEQALISGWVRNMQLLFHGPVADFPFYRNEGVFESSIEAQNVELRFHPDWPPLTQTDARLLFYGPGMEIGSTKGQIGQGRILEAHAVAEDLDRSPWLTLSGTARTTVPDSLDFLAHSPIRDIPEKLAKFVTTAGETDISLNLTIPLDKKLGDTAVEGKAEFKDATLRIEDTGLELRHINGPLHFTRTGLSANGIRASVLDHPAVIGVAPENDDIVVELKGRAGVSDLQRQFPGSFWRLARGTTDYRLGLRIPESLGAESDPLVLALSSGLTGMELNLPAPFGKSEKTRKDLFIEMVIRTGSKIPLRLTYGQDIAAQLRLSQSAAGLKLQGGDVAVGAPLASTGPEPGVAVFARVDSLEAAEWRRLLPDSPDDPSNPNLLRKLDLNVRTMYWNGEVLGPLTLDVQREGQRWQGRLDSGYGKGTFEASADSVTLDLEHLKLPKLNSHETEPANAVPLDPAAVPNLALKAKRLLWQGADLGPFVLETERHAHGMIVKALQVETKNHRFDIHGGWTRSADRTVSTRIEGKIRIEDMGDFLTAFDYAGEVRDTPSDIDFALSWPGAPQRFSRSEIAGDIKMKLSKGALLKVEPGLGRVLGMLNLDTLWRRLSFDFSDLFGKGLAYDGVRGTFQLGKGQAITKGFLIDAVPAKIVINGRAGLVARDLDQIVTVIPHTSVALPIAGALAGGPAVGAAVLLAQQLVGEKVDSITATHYAVKGSWDEPQITKISRNLPLDILDRAWSGMKDLSGFGTETEKKTND
ncbi:YhdP family protein [Methylocaldum sp.]|uniref:YhdP family protein n=1 Tax=Methylocaldum sp. TaxID=1969727 RepID=UPI002D2A1328|nr:YhdP family protein [Methylocaldum sp.]HYE35035.1 YhdP family protein [Methylocaldum sp.]